MFRRSRVISSSAPNGSSMSSSAGSNESARAIETRCCMPPESCHGRLDSKPVSSTSSSISRTRSLPLRPVPAEQLERQARRSSLHGAPVVEHRRLEHDPVVAVDPRLVRRLAVDASRLPDVGSTRSPMIRSSVDFPHPDGPISETNSPGAISRSMSCSAVTPVPKTFVRPLIETTLAAALTRGAPARGARRASRRARPTTNKTMPSTAADDVRRPQERRLERVVLVEVEDRAAETVLDRRGRLADDRADHARRRRDLQRREDVRQRRGDAQAARGCSSGSTRTSASARTRADPRTGGHAAC